MSGDQWSKAVITRQNLDNSRWEELLSELNKLDVTVRSKGRWLDDNSIPRDQSWSNFSESQMDWKVPWHNSTADTQRSVANNNLSLVRLLGNLILNLHLRNLSNPIPTRIDLGPSSRERLALLLGQELSEALLLSHDGVGVVVELLCALGVRSLAPCRERGAGGLDGVVEVFLGRDWDLWVLLFGGWVDAVAGGLAVDQLAVDDVLECGEVESHDCSFVSCSVCV